MTAKSLIRIDGATAYVSLSKGYEALIDVSDADEIGRYRWYALVRPHTVYAFRNGKNDAGRPCIVLMHRQLLHVPKGTTVDHINHNGIDNRRANLREASYKQNAANTRIRRDNSSGARGVDWRHDRQKWRAQITIDGKAVSLGNYARFEDAIAAYAAAAYEAFGPFAPAMLEARK